MTGDSQELDKIFNIMLITGGQRYNYSTRQLREAKQAILDWHDKRVEAVLDRLEGLGGSHPDSHIAIFIEAERNRLKEKTNDQL